ncbi:uncharacterized protein [Temnothorax nylanderi]|uniref:uncharacterized protein isoform X2 n=1 Tax=Temnothorax nylanderi TaxID=102681 RepID=UPI003A87E5C2
MNCAVKGCKNYYRKTKKLGKKVQYFSFPKENDMALKWLEVCKTQDTKEPINASTHINDSTDVIDAVVSTDVVDVSSTSIEDTSKNTTVAVISSPAATNLCSPNNDIDYIKKLQWELAVLKKKFNIYKKKKEVDLVAMKKKVQQFKRNQSFEADKKYETKMYDVLKKVFTPGQIRMLLNPSQKYVNWSSEDIASAMSLRCVSPKAYRYLKNVMKIPLPSLQTLRRWATDINVEPGVLNAILDCMRFKSKSMPDFETLVILTFDEVYLSNKVAIDRKKQQVVGPHKTCQCVMVRSLFGNWKQPVYYNYDTPMTKDNILHIISRLYNVGYTVVAMTCDMGPTNMALWLDLGIGIAPKKYYFQHPINENYKIYVFADMPHLLKLARNHFLDNGFSVGKHRVDKKCIERILSINSRDMKISHNISQYHLDVQGSERQKVRPAAQLLSETTASSTEWYGQKGYLNNFDWAETARVIRLFNDWFDIFNASSKFGKHEGKNAYGVILQKQNNILSEMNKLMHEIKIGKHKTLISFQKGIIVTNNSLQELLPYVTKLCSDFKFNVEYILTRRLNQDVLENFFSFIRATGGAYDQPTALDFKYRLRKYILGKQSKNLFCNIGSSNVMSDSDSPLVSSESCHMLSEMLTPYVLPGESHNEEEELCEYNINNNNVMRDISNDNSNNNVLRDISNVNNNIILRDKYNFNNNHVLRDEYYSSNNDIAICDLSTYHATVEEEQLLASLDDMNITDIIEDEGLKYVAGYVAYRFKSKYPQLGVETREMPTINNGDWIQFISRGKCMYPSEDMIATARIMNIEFEKYHGSNLRKDQLIFNKLADIIHDKIQPIQLPRDVILCLVRTRTYIRVRVINRQICESNRKKNRRRKLVKFTNNKIF